MYRSTVHSTLLLVLLTACVSHVNPNIAPEQLPFLQPTVQSRVLLLIVPSFIGYTTEASSDMKDTYYHLGESTAAALIDVVKRSFGELKVLQATEAQGYQVMAAPSDTTITDLVIVPHFEGGGFANNAWTAGTGVRLRLDVRSYRNGGAYSWIGEGHSKSATKGYGTLYRRAISQALTSLVDSMRVHRSQLDFATEPRASHPTWD
jgi:hypothetical protein